MSDDLGEWKDLYNKGLIEDDPAKPCPFCGGKNILEDITQYSQRFLRCDDCGCIGPTLQETDRKGSGPDSDIEWDRLWELWNERD